MRGPKWFTFLNFPFNNSKQTKQQKKRTTKKNKRKSYNRIIFAKDILPYPWKPPLSGDIKDSKRSQLCVDARQAEITKKKIFTPQDFMKLGLCVLHIFFLFSFSKDLFFGGYCVFSCPFDKYINLTPLMVKYLTFAFLLTVVYNRLWTGVNCSGWWRYACTNIVHPKRFVITPRGS